MQVWIKYPQFHWIGVQATHKLMQEHVSKRAKMQKSKESQTGGTRQAYQYRTEWGEGCICEHNRWSRHLVIWSRNHEYSVFLRNDL